MGELKMFEGESMSFASTQDKEKFLKNTPFIIWGLTTWGVFLNKKLNNLGNNNVTIWDRLSEGKVDIFNVKKTDIENSGSKTKSCAFIVLAFTAWKNTEECGALLKKSGFKNIVTAHDLLLFIKKKGPKTKIIKIGFGDWTYLHNDYKMPYKERYREDFTYNLLKYSDDFEVVSSDNPDYLLCDVNGGMNRYDFDGVRIRIQRELLGDDFDVFDYSVGFQKLDYGDRYFQKLFFFEEYALGKIIQLALSKREPDKKERGFCGLLSSNPHAMARALFFGKLRKYKEIDSAGRAFKNVEGRCMHFSNFLPNYKFSISFENASYENYVTEKIIRDFLSDTVPIYFGAPNIAEYFNDKAFINCHDFETFDEAIERIIEIDNDEAKYLEMLHSPCMTDKQIKMFLDNEEAYKKFLLNIFEQNYDDAFRRPRSTYIKEIEKNIYLNQGKLIDCEASLFPNRIMTLFEERDMFSKIAQNIMRNDYDNSFFVNNNYKRVAIIWTNTGNEVLSEYIKQLYGVEFTCFIDFGFTVTSAQKITPPGKCLNWMEISQLEEDTVILCPPKGRALKGYEFEYIKEFIKTLTDVPVVSALEALGIERKD